MQGLSRKVVLERILAMFLSWYDIFLLAFGDYVMWELVLSHLETICDYLVQQEVNLCKQI